MAAETTVHPPPSRRTWTATVVTSTEQTVPGEGQAAPDAPVPSAAADHPAAPGRILPTALGFVAGLAIAAAFAGISHLRAEATEAAQESLQARVARIEATLDEVVAAAERPDGAVPRRVQDVAAQVPENSRFIAAALLLQAAVATPRPWTREYQAMVALAPAGALPRPLAEVLLSHAARGLPTEAELRERYAALMPQLIVRAPHEASLIERSMTAVRAAFAGIGLAAPPAPTDQEQAIAGVAQQLRRGNLAAAVADASALDASLQPLLAGWLVQAGARLAVEQAVQETLLRALTAPPRPI